MMLIWLPQMRFRYLRQPFFGCVVKKAENATANVE